MHIYIHAHTHTHIYIRMYVFIYVCMYMYKHTYIHITYIHIYSHIDIDTYTYTQINTCRTICNLFWGSPHPGLASHGNKSVELQWKSNNWFLYICIIYTYIIILCLFIWKCHKISTQRQNILFFKSFFYVFLLITAFLK